MSKKNKTDFIDEDEFLSTVTMNKKGGCVRMGKPPHGNEEPSRNEDMQEESITSRWLQNEYDNPIRHTQTDLFEAL